MPRRQLDASTLARRHISTIDFMYNISVGGWESGRCDADSHTLMHTYGVLSNSMKYSAHGCPKFGNSWLSQMWKPVVIVSRTMRTCGNGAHLLLQARDADDPSKSASMSSSPHHLLSSSSCWDPPRGLQWCIINCRRKTTVGVSMHCTSCSPIRCIARRCST